MSEFLKNFLLEAIPELAKAFMNSLYIGLSVLSLLILSLAVSFRKRKQKEIEKKDWITRKAEHYQRFYKVASEFEKLVSDFEYLTLKTRRNNEDCLESVLLSQLKDKIEELTLIVDTLKQAKYPKDRELFTHGYFSSNRYISHVERVMKTTRDYIERHYSLEEAMED